MNRFAPWKVMHIELSEDISTLTAEPKYQGIYAIFWWCGIPLGHEEISAAQLPMSAAQLVNLAVQKITPAVGDRLLNQGFKAPLPVISQNPSRDAPPEFQSLIALQQPLKRLQECSLQPVSGSVSVVVCTRNRPEQLVRCLRSLQNLSQPPQQIIVIDNAPSDDATRQLVAQMPGIQYMLEPRPGLSVARNTGIRHSIGDIIAFTDDDVEVHPNWIARLQQSFENPKVMAVTGLILPGELETEAQVAFEKGFGGFNQGYRVLTFDSQFFEEMRYRGVPVWHIGAGANMAFRRKAFELVGYFDERLGAGASGCSEDSEFWYRILAEGWFCHYEPTAVVYHFHRSDLDSLKHQIYQYMRGHVAALLVQFARYKHWGNLYRLFVTLPKYYTRQFFSGLLKGFNFFNKMLFVEVLGCFSGVQYYLQNK
ncbi:MAG: glycosyltransferase [Scytonema sp. RU_4_4]|nr:glycosyltransferase [Scytonema sp. RU_4_4]